MLKLRDFVNLWVVEDLIQDLDTVICNIFQIYFYDNLFNSDKNSKIQNKTKLLGDQQQSEKVINDYAKEHDITVT